MDKIAKAIVSAVTAGSAALVTGVSDAHVTAIEYVLVGAATVVGFFSVWATPNAPTPRSTGANEGGTE